MSKKWLAGAALTAGLLFSVIGGEDASAKVMWDGAEIGAGQTGKLAFNKDTKIYKKNADGTFTSMVSKKGSFWRVYGQAQTSTGTVYNMSGGYRVQATNLTTYKSVPLYIQGQVQLKTTTQDLLKESSDRTEADISYLQLHHLSNGALERQINSYLKSYAQEQVGAYREMLAEREEEVLDWMDWENVPYLQANNTVPGRSLTLEMTLDYNSKGYITIGFHESTYHGGAHGMYGYSGLTYNLATNKQVSLSDFIKTPAQRAKVSEYVRQQMIAANRKEDGTFVLDWYEGLDMKQPFYLKDDGIMLVYNPYDAGSYASGMRTVFVPFSAM